MCFLDTCDQNITILNSPTDWSGKNSRETGKISRVDVVFKTHLDIGFTDLAGHIVRRYREDYIPAALALARQTRETPHRFVWTTGSWLVHHYLETASPSGRRKMEEAVAAGDFYWHALPFTTHTELMDEGLFRLGLEYSRVLDRRFGRRTRAAKMTDVPGHTCAMIPLLAEAGVRFLHIGVNPASSLPVVPPVFLWRFGSKEVVVMYEETYGGVTRLPGDRALSVNLTGDNLGPQNPGEIDKVYSRLAEAFPGARLRAGSLNESAAWLWKNRSSLPVVEREIGDTWIHGVGTDPCKVAAFRELSRLRRRWIGQGRLAFGSRTDFAFGGNLLLVAEHTWGLDLKSHLKDWKNYQGESFRRARRTRPFKLVESSWTEQRAYLRTAVDALPGDLRTEAEHALAALKPVFARKRRAALARKATAGAWTADAGRAEGKLSLRKVGGPAVGLRFLYQTYSQADYRRFYRDYIRWAADWSLRDFTKPGLPSSVKAAKHWLVWSGIRPGSDGWSVAEGAFGPGGQKSGAPGTVLLGMRADGDALEIRLEWRDKPANRRPEALWLNFRPFGDAADGWRIRKLGQAIDPANVVEKGALWLHATDGEVTGPGCRILSPDAALVAPGLGRLLDFRPGEPRFREGVSFNLYNNIWGTNFPMWSEDDAVFRFRLEA